MKPLSARTALTRLSLISLAAMACAAQAQAPAAPVTAEQRSTLADQQAIALTIYNDDLALVKDTRQLALPRGGEFDARRARVRIAGARPRPRGGLSRARLGGLVRRIGDGCLAH